MVQQNQLIQNRYRIIRLLGTGGFARVYLAEDQRLGRRVAVKELHSSRLAQDEQQAALDLFEREARMLAQLDHPGLTNIWDYFQHEGRAYLVMEYVPGPTLRDLVLAHGGPLPDPLVLACGIQLCDVLSYLHSRPQPVIFRDLKPGNVIVESDTDEAVVAAQLTPDTLQLKLIDFGIARLFKPEQSSDTMIIGTPGYASPEQYGQGQTDARSDIYSLGATLHHLASGAAPGGLILPPLLEAAPDASPALARIIARATALKPNDRYQTVEAMRRDLLGVVSPQPRVTSAPQPSYATTKLPPASSRLPAPPRNKPPVLLGMIALALIGLIALGAVAVRALGRDGGAAPSAGEQPNSGNPAAETGLLPGATGKLLYGQFDSGRNQYDIWLTTMDGQEQRIVGDGENTATAWSPDGKLVAVTRDAAIYIGPLDNPTERQISADDVFARYPAFSPDGRYLAYSVSSDLRGAYRLVITDLQTGATREVGLNYVAWIMWSRQDQLTFAARPQPNAAQDIFILEENDRPRNLTNTPDIEEDFPSWSPDGRQLAFTASPSGQANLPQRQIYLMDANGGNRKQLTQSQGPHTNAVWSPEGKWIAYASQQSGQYEVWAVRPDGSDNRQVTLDGGRKFFLAWGQ